MYPCALHDVPLRHISGTEEEPYSEATPIRRPLSEKNQLQLRVFTRYLGKGNEARQTVAALPALSALDDDERRMLQQYESFCRGMGFVDDMWHPGNIEDRLNVYMPYFFRLTPGKRQTTVSLSTMRRRLRGLVPGLQLYALDVAITLSRQKYLLKCVLTFNL
jgi:hypothetical protein